MPCIARYQFCLGTLGQSEIDNFRRLSILYPWHNSEHWLSFYLSHYFPLINRRSAVKKGVQLVTNKIAIIIIKPFYCLIHFGLLIRFISLIVICTVLNIWKSEEESRSSIKPTLIKSRIKDRQPSELCQDYRIASIQNYVKDKG